MKYMNNKILLEAIQRGIKLALDDFEDNEIQDQSSILSKKKILNYDAKDDFDFYNFFVDLGLPSGTLWCKYNLGVNLNNLNKPEDWYGDYYMWGDVTPIEVDFESKECDYCDWNNYIHAVPNCNKCLIKYCNKSNSGYEGFTDNLIHLLPEDDAAYLNMHYKNYKFYTPTQKLWEELLEYTTLEKVENYKVNGKQIIGLNGYELTGKNGLKIFFPFAGYCDDLDLGDTESQANYWTSELCLTNPDFAYVFYCDYNKIIKNIDIRCYGFSIRPVLNLN